VGLAAWKKTIDEQMHFMDMLQRIRLLGLSLALTISGAAGLALKATEVVPITIFGLRLPIAVFIQFFAVVLVVGLMFSESYYFALLLGAVRYAEELEEHLGLGLTRMCSYGVPRHWAMRRIAWFWYSALVPAMLFLFILIVFGDQIASQALSAHASSLHMLGG
jgi:hypothetical protein